MAASRILLTGDARGDKTLKGLEQADLLTSGVLKVDVLKVPHHGSNRNVKPDYFKKIIAETYVFSGNGDNGNPDRDTLEMLFDVRDRNDRYDVVLTYTVEEIDRERKAYALSRHMALGRRGGFPEVAVRGKGGGRLQVQGP